MNQERIEELEQLMGEAEITEPLCVDYKELGSEDNRRLFAFLMEGDAEDGTIVCVDEEPVGMESPSPRLELIAAAVNALPELIAMARRVEGLQAENTKLKAALEPDMFWDQDNPEQPYYDVEELLREQDYDRDRDIILDTQEAIRCEDGAYFCRINSPPEDSETDDEEVIIRRLTDDERKQWRAVYRVWLSMQYLKPLFARTTLKEQG